jgi:hypothetical protein
MKIDISKIPSFPIFPDLPSAGSLHLDFSSPIPSSTQLDSSPFPRRAAQLDASPSVSGDAVLGTSLLVVDLGLPGGDEWRGEFIGEANYINDMNY